MSMSPATLAALQSRNPLLVFMLRIELPDGRVIRLLDGAGYAIWGEEAYTGSDPDFGVIAGFGDFTEVEGTESPRQTVQLLPRNNAAIAALTDPSVQGSPVAIWAVAVSPHNGQIIGEPDSLFVGELDDASYNLDRNSSLLELELATVWERLFDDNEGNRWNDTFWTYLHGQNARAFEYVHLVGQQNYWGFNGPAKGSGGSSYGGSGSIGGGVGGGLHQVAW